MAEKFKILLLGQDWLQVELQRLGHEVVSASITNRRCDVFVTKPGLSFTELLQALPDGFLPDRLVYWDDSTVPWVVGLEESSIPKLFFAVDTHQHYHWHPQFSSIFDQTLVAQKDFLHLFQQYSAASSWMPLWATKQALPLTANRDLDVVFVGTIDPILHPERAKFFDRVRQKVPINIVSGDYLEPYSRAKIVLNQVVNGDLNFRIFEALNSGALLITPRIGNGLLELFKDQRELVCYENGDADDAVQKIQYYLLNNSEREQISKSGSDVVHSLHQTQNRAAILVKNLQELRNTDVERRSYGAAFAYLAGFITCSNQGIPWGNRLFIQGVKCLVGATNLTSKEESGVAVIYSHYRRELNGIHSAIDLLLKLQHRSPLNRAITLALIKELIAADRRNEAILEAARISDSPEATCMQVSNLLAQELA